MPRKLRGWRRLNGGVLAGILAASLLVASASVLAEGPTAPQPLAGWTTVSLPMVASRYAAPAVTYSRFGVGAPRPYDVVEYSVQALGAGWYWDWAARPEAERPLGVAYYPTIRLAQVGATGFSFSPSEQTIADTAAAHPGAVWLIGNEPDRKWTQDDLVPEAYANAYAHLYDLIKELDPTALIAAGQIVQPTPLRLEYLDRVLDAYYAAHGAAMPVDVWAIHAYPLREDDTWGAGVPPGVSGDQPLLIDVEDTKSIELFQSFLVDFRAWMAARGYQDRPLIVSEFGVLVYEDWEVDENGTGPFDTSNVVRYLETTLEILSSLADPQTGYPGDDYRLVQQWAWYCLTNDVSREGPLAGWLYDAGTRTLNPSGQAFRQYVNALPRTVNLRPVALSAAPDADDPSSMVLTAAVLNNGSVSTGSSVRVRFYHGDPDSGGVQIGADQVIQDGIAGGAVPRLVQATWPYAPSGAAEIHVVVDPDHTVSETDPDDNRLSTLVLIPEP